MHIQSHAKERRDRQTPRALQHK